MSGLSLRLRLALVGAAGIVLVLLGAAAGLTALFGVHVERRAVAELEVQLDQVLSGLVMAPEGLAIGTEPADPRFARPYSGLYWQIDSNGRTLRSRSLWDDALTLPDETGVDGEAVVHRLTGPRDAPLLVVERIVRLPQALGGGSAKAAVAMEITELALARRAFAVDLAPYLVLLAAVLIGAQVAQLGYGLRPLKAIGTRVAALSAGRARRMGGGWPAEMRPLAGEIDRLLEAREKDVERARARAADLAHGLKTPLQALLGEAGRLRERGDATAAAAVEEMAGTMQLHVERELARARAAAQGRLPGRTSVAEMVGKVLAVLKRTPNGAKIARVNSVDSEHFAAIDAADLAEAFGALAENAARHASARVEISAIQQGERIRLVIADDGPGIPTEALETIVRRGRRLDESGPGAGLGLAIATAIAEAAGGKLELRNGETGLIAMLDLPRAR